MIKKNLIFCMMLFMMSMNCISSNWMDYGNYDISWYDADKKVFSLKNVNQVAGLSYLVNNNISTFKGCSFSLESDINLNGNDWIPIGSKDYAFEGDFDGNGYSIKGISISRYDSDYVGFFGRVNNSSIKNFAIEGSIRQRDKASIRCGLVSGQARISTFENLKVDVNLYLDKTERHDYNNDCYWDWYHGGVVGDSEYCDYSSIVSNVYIQDNIGGQQNHQSDIKRSIYMGGVVGRMLGGSIDKCVAHNNYNSNLYLITSENHSIKVIFGGIVGFVENSKSSDPRPYKITTCAASNYVKGYYNMAVYTSAFGKMPSGHFKLGGILGTTMEDTESRFLNKETQIECCIALNKRYEIEGTDTKYISTWSKLGGILGSEEKYQPGIFSSNYSNSDCEIVFKDVKYEEFGVDGSSSYSSARMQTQAFIDELNQLTYLKYKEQPWILDSTKWISLKDIGPFKPTVPVEKITIIPEEYELCIGESKDFSAQVLPENATDKTVKWISSDSKIATVNSNGKVTAVSEGTTKISCNATDGSGVSASCHVTVKSSVQEGETVEVNSLRYRIYPSDKRAIVARQTQYLSGTITIPERISYKGENYTVTEVGDSAFWKKTVVKGVNISSTVKKIGAYAFYGMSSLESIEIPDNVESIGREPFGFCGALESVYIGKGLKTLGIYPFWRCPKLTSIRVSTQNQYFTSEGNVLYSKDHETVYKVPETMSKVTLHASVKLISNGCFGCNDLIEDIDLPTGLSEIAAQAFMYCDNLKSIDIPDNVTNIFGWAFEECKSLQSIKLGKKVKQISKGAFATSSKYAIVYIRAEVPPTIEESTFDNYAATLYVPIGCKNAYASADYWKNFAKIEAYDFNDYPSLNSISEAIDKAALLENREYSEPYIVNFEPTVTYANGAYNYIVDEGRYFLIYQDNLGLEAGKTVNKGWAARLHNYNDLLELAPLEDAAVTNGEAVGIPEPLRIENVRQINKDVMNAVVYIPNVVLTEATPDSKVSFTGKLGNQSFILYNQFGLPSTPAGTYDIIATVGRYYDQLEVQPIEYINTDAVYEINMEEEAVYFDMQGNRVSHPQPGGIYIRKHNRTIDKVIIPQ